MLGKWNLQLFDFDTLCSNFYIIHILQKFWFSECTFCLYNIVYAVNSKELLIWAPSFDPRPFHLWTDSWLFCAVIHLPDGPTATSQFEHSSIPATVKKLFNLESNFLTKRDAWAGTFESYFNLRDSPRDDCPGSHHSSSSLQITFIFLMIYLFSHSHFTLHNMKIISDHCVAQFWNFPFLLPILGYRLTWIYNWITPSRIQYHRHILFIGGLKLKHLQSCVKKKTSFINLLSFWGAHVPMPLLCGNTVFSSFLFFFYVGWGQCDVPWEKEYANATVYSLFYHMLSLDLSILWKLKASTGNLCLFESVALTVTFKSCLVLNCRF